MICGLMIAVSATFGAGKAYKAMLPVEAKVSSIRLILDIEIGVVEMSLVRKGVLIFATIRLATLPGTMKIAPAGIIGRTYRMKIH